MNELNIIKKNILIFIASLAITLLGCTSNSTESVSSTPMENWENNAGEPSKNTFTDSNDSLSSDSIPLPSRTGQILNDITIRETEKELSSEAKNTFAFLLFLQAIMDEDEAALLDSVPHLKEAQIPAHVWLDGALWLMNRKSPNSVLFLEEALKSLPDDTSLALLYGEALGDHGMPDRGVEAMKSFLQHHPDNLDVKLELALLLVKDKKYIEARKILDNIPSNQRTPLVDYYHAKALVGMENKTEAIPYLRKAVKGMPEFVEALAELAFLYEQDGEWKEARTIYEKLKKLHFSPQEVSLRLVNISLRLKQPEKALQYIKQGPDSIPFKLTAANMLLDAHHYLQAEGILKQIANMPDAPPDTYLLLAELAFEHRRDLKLAFSWLDKIAHDSKAAPKAKLFRIQLLADDNQIAKAIKTALDGQKEYPEMPEFFDFEIRLLARQKKSAEALEAATRALDKWPNNTDLNFLYGSLLDEAGKKKEAMNVMEKLLEKQPDNFQALNYVGYTLAEENRDLERALKLLEKADQLSPNQSYIIDSLAWALFRLGQNEAAIEKIRKAVALSDNADAAIWEHYGDIASKLGYKEEARKAYRKAISLNPANINTLRQRLAHL